MITEPATQHIAKIRQADVDRYVTYLEEIRPRTPEDRFRRWLFAYASVHTTWKMNCHLYQWLEDLKWLGKPEELRQRIVISGAGMYNKRTAHLSEFAQFYWDHPDWFRKSIHEDWATYRNRLENAAKGIGPTKASFWIELTQPIEAQVICIDTHVLQLYGYSPKEINQQHSAQKSMSAIEKHWVEACKARGIPPVVARWLFWDGKQGHPDSRYWSFVFEKEKQHV